MFSDRSSECMSRGDSGGVLTAGETALQGDGIKIRRMLAQEKLANQAVDKAPL